MNTKSGYFLEDDISAFDASFFNLSSETASAMDPQMRLQLESVYEATEDGKLKLHLETETSPCTNVRYTSWSATRTARRYQDFGICWMFRP